jgi:hypothetical protein
LDLIDRDLVVHWVEHFETKCIEEVCAHDRAALWHDEELEGGNGNAAILDRQLDDSVNGNWSLREGY